MRGAPRWPAGVVMPGARRGLRRARGAHRRRARHRRPAPSTASSVRGPRRRPVRLLHARFSGDRQGAARRTPASKPRPDSRGACRLSVPLHGVPADLRGGRSRGGARRRGVGEWRTRRERGSRGSPAMNIIGNPRRRVDGRAKVTGQTRFADDVMLPRMVHCKLLRSTVPHARVLRVDATRALARPGVHLVLTGRDFPVPYGILPVSQDEHALAVDRVRFVGDPVAAVIARDELTAFEALDDIDVEYEPLRTFADPEESLAHPEPRIHEYGDSGNIHKAVSLRFGVV